MVNEVILHIGMHKTGSTSIQNGLKGYDDGTTFYARFPEANHSAAIRGAFSTRPEDYHQWRKLGLARPEIMHRRTKYRKQLIRDLTRPDRDRLLISGEGIGFLDEQGKQDLLDFLRQHVDTVRVVCYVRPPLEFAASYLQQQIKTGKRALPDKVKTDYRKRLAFFSEQLSPQQISVKAFGRETLHQGCVVSDFCRTVGIDGTKVPKSRVNTSLSAPALKLLHAFNRSNPCFEGDPVVHQAHHLLIHWIDEDYRSGPSVEKSRFLALADFSELPYLRDQFGLHFEPAHTQADHGAPSFDAWLKDTNDIDPTPLKQRLQALGVHSKNQSFCFLINRLYYQAVATTAVRHRQIRIQPETISWGLLCDTMKSLTVAGTRTLLRRKAP